MQPRIFILDTIEKLDQFKEYVSENKFTEVAFDLETNDKTEVKAITWGIGLSFDEEEGFYIPVKTNTAELYFDEDVTKSNIEFVTNLLQTTKIITHNGLYDILVWEYNTGVDLTAHLYADTILYKHLVDEERPFGLKETAVKYLGPWSDKAQEALYENIERNGGTTTKDNVQMWKADTQVLGEYGAYDVVLTFKLYKLFREKIEKEGLVELLETETMPLYRNVTINMKRKGVSLDIGMYLEKKEKITQVIKDVELGIIEKINDLIEPFVQDLLCEEFPIKHTGNFPKAYAAQIGLELPSLAKKAVANIEPKNTQQELFKHWLIEKQPEDGLFPELVRDSRRAMWSAKYPEDPYVFNLGSKAHLKWLFFEKLGEKPLSTTEKGEPQVDDAFLESIKDKYSWVADLQDYNVLNKMSGTYIQGMLDRQIDGKLYTSFLQFGTTSGRFASSGPNLQNWVAPQNTGRITDEFVNSIRHGIIAKPGHKLVGIDFSAAEPNIAAYVSGDENLIDIFVKGLDFYSAIAIRQFNLTHLSADKNASNYLGNHEKELRDKIKAYALSLFYGASPARISQMLKCSREEAEALVNGYLGSFPGIKNFIDTTHYNATTKGYVKTIFGRVRHLPRLRELHETYGSNLENYGWAKKNHLLEERGIYKNLLNNAVNFQIQGTAGHAMNRAMIKTVDLFKNHGILGYPVMQVHDEQIIEVRADQAEKAAELAKLAMETAVNLDPIKLKATPIIGNSYGECK